MAQARRFFSVMVLCAAAAGSVGSLAPWCAAAQPAVRFGIDVLQDDGFKQLAGKRVGLVANPAAVDARLRATSDVLAGAKGVQLVALFGPEHGIYGNAYAGDTVGDAIDPRTGRKLYSLYGKTNRPTTQQVKDLDAIVFDLQDIGARSYTYIATMKRVMQSCAEHDREFIVLDRANPLGGVRIEGPALREGYESGVSSLPVPYLHGMTMGELARFTREKFFPKFEKLTVIPMRGWKREMVWAETGHEWVPTSPHVPTARAAAAYAATGILGELYVINIGVGYTLPFEMVGSPWIDGEALAGALPRQRGVIFRPVHFRPFYGTFQGEPCEGVQVHLDPKTAENLVEVNYRLARALNAPELFAQADAKAQRAAEAAADARAAKAGKPAATRPVRFDARTRMFDKVSGSDEARQWLMTDKPLEPLFARWRKECEQFRKEREKWLLY